MWTRRACDATLRREQAAGQKQLNVPVSFNASRKFRSSELVNAGSNLSPVAERQSF
jgi:hypothetical protein